MSQSARERVWALADQLEAAGRTLQRGRPRNKKIGHVRYISESLGISERSVNLALKARRIAKDAPDPLATLESGGEQLQVVSGGPRTPTDAVRDLQAALDRFIDDMIAQPPGSLNPRLVLWAEDGITILKEPW
jgi:hypothetical protein